MGLFDKLKNIFIEEELVDDTGAEKEVAIPPKKEEIEIKEIKNDAPAVKEVKEEVNEALYDVLIVPMNTNIESLKLANSLRKDDIKVLIEMNNRKLKKVFESADKNNVPYVIVLGENEVNEGTIEIKDMKNKTTSKFNINDIEGMKEYINK